LSMMLLALLAVVMAALQTETAQTATMQSDADRRGRAAEGLAGTWPAQPPLLVPEGAIVARHGNAVVPPLMALLSAEKVQQQVTLTLSQISSESQHCRRIDCDGDPPGRIGRVSAGWLNVIASDKEMQAVSSRELLDRFKMAKVFWRQFEIGQALAAADNRGAIAELEMWLTYEDRHLRGNVAFVLGRLGDPRGFETIAAILADRSPRSAGQGIPGGNWTVQAQIRADRYYAAHLLGDLKDPRGVDLLIPLLNDKDVDYIVPWSLAEIGDRRGIAPLVAQTERDDPSLRVLSTSCPF
jgi:HEAT repeat protein